MNSAKASAGSGKAGIAVLVMCGIVAVAGCILWLYQMSSGLVVTNMRTLDSWGLYLTNFMFFVGLSAGGLIVSSIPKVFGIEGFGPIAKVSVWVSIVCTCLAAVFIVVDLGQPLRLWELLTFQNMSSPLLWDVIVISSYLVVSSVYLVLINRYEKGVFGAKPMRVYATVALILAIAVHSVTAWIFSLNISREFWHTALMAPWFVCSALVSGLGLVMVVCAILRKKGYLNSEIDFVKMGKFLGVFVLVDLYFFGCDIITSAYGNEGGREIVAMLFSGQLAPFFWTEAIGGIVAATICFVPKFRSGTSLTIAALLAILGVFCKRCQIMLAGFGMLNLEFAGIEVHGFPLTSSGEMLAESFGWMTYFPSPIEFAITLGVIALGGVMLILGFRYLPLGESR